MIDPYSDVPEHILNKISSVSLELKRLGFKKWQILGVADRKLVEELDGIVIACYRAFCHESSDFAKRTALQLLEDYVKENRNYYYQDK